MIRVVLVSHYFPAHRGGVEVVAGQLANELGRSGDVALRWFACDCNEVPVAVAGTATEPVRCWNVLERKTGLPYPLWSPQGIIRLIRAIKGSHLVHIHEYIYIGNLAAFAAARWYGKPLLLTQHIGAIPYRSRILHGVLNLVNRTVGRFVLERADQVVFISQSVQDYFFEFVRFRRPPRYVANGVNTETFYAVSPQDRREVRAALGLDIDRPLLLFVGRFVEKKGLQHIRGLASRMPDVDWLFAGWGPMHPGNWGLPNVRVLEGRSGGSLRPLYQSADLLVLPSVGEGFPLVVQEAMACGTPAVVSDETAKGSRNAADVLYAESIGEDVEDRWSARIRAILADPAGLAERRTEVATFARENWATAMTTAAYRELFNELAEHRNSGLPRGRP